MSIVLVLSIRLGPGARDTDVRIPTSALPGIVSSLTSATPRQRRVLVKGYIAAHAGEARMSWLWLGSPATRWDRLPESEQDDIAQQLLERLQQALRERTSPLVQEIVR